MKQFSFQLMMLVLFTVAVQHSNAQCTGCTTSFTGSATDQSFNTAGEVYCLTSGTQSASLNFNFSGAATLCIAPGATFTGSINLNNNNADLTIINYGTFNSSGNLILTNDRDVTIVAESPVTFGALSIGNTGSLITTGDINITSSVNINGATTQLSMSDGTINMAGSVSFANAGNVTFDNVDMDIAGSVTLNNDSDLTITGSNIDIGGAFSMSNTSSITGGSSAGDCSRINVAGSSAINNSASFGDGDTHLDMCDPSGSDANCGFDTASGGSSCSAVATSCECNPTVLPIELLGIAAKANKNRSVEIQWQTASEYNNEFFSIERSFNGHSFESIGNIDGAGNSEQVLTYAFTDSEPQQGINYYRLKQVDLDGSYSYSKVVVALIAQAKTHPMNTWIEGNQLFIHNNLDANSQVILYNSLGETIYQSFIGSEQTDLLNISGLPSGIYICLIQSEAITQEQKVVQKVWIE